MMTPIQRVTRYQLLLRDMEKSFRQAGVPDMHADVLRAYEIAHEIAEYANNMMSAGRISGFEVSTVLGVSNFRGDTMTS